MALDDLSVTLAHVAERRIREAVGRGELSGLPGEGRRLELDDDSLVAPELRLAYRVLKNAGLAPEGVRVRREIARLEQWVRDTGDAAERACAGRRLACLRALIGPRDGTVSRRG